MHTCVICDEKFPVWMAYHLHTAMFHNKAIVVEERPIVGIKKPLSRVEKAAIVARGEARIGREHFIGA